MFSLRHGSNAIALVAAVAIYLAVSPFHSADAGDHGSRLSWRKSYKQASDEARRKKRPILVKITASWCGPCRQMQQLTFTDERVQKQLGQDFVLLEVDADEHPDLVSGFRVEAFPTTLVVSPELKVVKRLTGFQSATDLVKVLESVQTQRSNDQNEKALRRNEENTAGISTKEKEELSEVDTASALAVTNRPSVAFEGFCLVSLLDEGRLRYGNKSITAEYNGQALSFVSENERQKFLADPSRYWPVANGQCLVSSKTGRTGEAGDPRAGVIWRNRLWFFSDRDSQKRFIESPHQ
ncbi:MAG: DUF255 domain-containing protein, partial [Planctomycetes bacterium]|nr:DUF255 domain-containing protein [Planctomycetota bacterium]